MNIHALAANLSSRCFCWLPAAMLVRFYHPFPKQRAYSEASAPQRGTNTSNNLSYIFKIGVKGRFLPVQSCA